MDKCCVYKMVSGSAIIFLVLYVDDILHIENDVSNFPVKEILEILHIKTYNWGLRSMKIDQKDNKSLTVYIYSNMLKGLTWINPSRDSYPCHME